MRPKFRRKLLKLIEQSHSHSEQHVGTLTFLEFEARFVPTRKHQGVFPTCVKIMGTLTFLEFEARFVPTRKHQGVFPTCVKIMGTLTLLEFETRFVPTRKRIRVFLNVTNFMMH